MNTPTEDVPLMFYGIKLGDLDDLNTLLIQTSRTYPARFSGRALSCMRMNPSPTAPAYGLTMGSRTSTISLCSHCAPVQDMKIVGPSMDTPP